MFTSRTLLRTTVTAAGLITLVAAIRADGAAGRMHTYHKMSEPAANGHTRRGAAHATPCACSTRTGDAAPIVAAIEGSVRAGTIAVAWSMAPKDGHPAQSRFAVVAKAAN